MKSSDANHCQRPRSVSFSRSRSRARYVGGVSTVMQSTEICGGICVIPEEPENGPLLRNSGTVEAYENLANPCPGFASRGGTSGSACPFRSPSAPVRGQLCRLHPERLY